MQKNKQYYIQQIDLNVKTLNDSILPKISQIQKHMKEFHNAELSEFESIIKNIENVQQQMREKQEQCQSYINEIKKKRKQNQKLGQISGGVLQAKSEEIKSKIKNIDAVSTGIKQTVSKIKPQKLIKLPVNSQRNLKNLFTVIYQTLYTQDQQDFDWDVFKKLALKHQNGQDFIFRLVNINFKDMSNHKYLELMKLKNDPTFQHISVNTTYSYDIIDLADWVDYVCLGYQFNDEKKKAEKEYDKIRKDMDKRSGSSLQMSEDFWKQASNQIENYQGDLQSINSELKTIIFGIRKSLDQSQTVQRNTTSIVQDLKSLLEIQNASN